MTVRLKDDADVDATSTRLATALEPVRSRRLRRRRVVRRRVHLERARTSSSPAETAADVDKATDGGRRRAGRPARPRQPQERPRQGDARGPGHGRSEQGDHRRDDAPPRSSNQVRSALVAQTGDDRSSRADGQTIQVIVQLDPDGRRHRSTSSRPCRSGPSPRSRSGTIATVEQVDVQGSITRIDQQPASSITAEITSDDTGAVSKSVQTELDALAASRRDPGRDDGRAGRRQPAAEPRRSAACSPRWASPSCSST